MQPPSEKRAARRAAKRRARAVRIRVGLAAAVLVVVGSFLMLGALRDRVEPVNAAAGMPVSASGQETATNEPERTPPGSAAYAVITAVDPETDADDNYSDAYAAPDADDAVSGADEDGASGAEDAAAGSGAAASDVDGASYDMDDTEASEAPEAGAAQDAPSPSSAGGTVRFTISAAGDCTFGGDTRSRTYSAFASAFKKGGAGYFLKNVREIFEADDLTIVNLEGPLTTAKRAKDKEFAFKGDPKYAKILTEGSVEAANLANNHAKDYYGKGLTDTASALRKVGVAPFGWGKTAILDIKGVKVGLCGFGVWYVSKSQMQKQIKSLKKECDLVIASFHWGEEGEGRALKVQKEYGRAAVNAGAGLVLGHHPHVVGGIEVYNGATIAYSLGNFSFGGNLNPADKDTFILQQTFEVGPEGVKPVETVVIPCSISGSKKKNDYQPVPLNGDAAKRVLDRIQKLSREFSTPVDLSTSRARLADAAA